MSEDARGNDASPGEINAALARMGDLFVRARAVNASFARRKGPAGARPDFRAQLCGPTNPQPQRGE